MARDTCSTHYLTTLSGIVATTVIVCMAYGLGLQIFRYREIKFLRPQFATVTKSTPNEILIENTSFPFKYYKPLLDISVDIKNYWLYFRSVVNQMDLRNKTSTVDDGYVAMQSGIRSLMGITLPERQHRLKAMSDHITKKIVELQFPHDCKKARLLLCDIGNFCGFGCTLHSLINCLLQAFVAGRTMVFRSKGWQYADEGWEYAFLPLGKCKDERQLTSIPKLSEASESERVVGLKSKVESWIHWSIPTELESELKQLHGHPYGWWLSRFTSYVFRLKPWLKKHLQTVEKEINFESSVVGIHVRWGDKIRKEAEKHQVEEYMVFVKRWFEQLENSGQSVNRTVYLATETPAVVADLTTRYPNFKFIGSRLVTTKTKPRSRYEQGGLESVLSDIYFLSKCDYLVCTLSSSVCRTAYELLNNRHGDATTRFQTVDTWYRLKRNFRNPWIAIMDHNPAEPDEIELRKGDQITVTLSAHIPTNDGFLRGTNQRTKQQGKFPVFKGREQVFSYNVSELYDITYPWI
ncbi:alpha-(1,6)-fucosyltransferase-like [Styela clava]